MATNATTPKPVAGRPAGLLTWIAVGLVLAVIATLVIIKVSTKTGKTAGDGVASAALVAEVANIAPSVFDTVGTSSPGATVAKVTPLKGQPLLTAVSPSSMKKLPALVYVGAEYCPYCAAERWAVIAALGRFGTWSGLKTTESATGDVYGGTQTFSFHGATYSSPYLVFNGYEMYSNQIDPALNPAYYYSLDKLPKSVSALFAKYDQPKYIPGMTSASALAFPFMSVGNQYAVSGAQFTPALLNKLSRENIAAGLSTAASPITDAIVASANYLSAAICKLTHNRPATVCTSSGVVAASKGL